MATRYSSGEVTGPFDVNIRVNKAQNKNIECEVTITNNGDKDFHLSVQNTPFEWLGHPLEGEASNKFVILNENETLVQYDGIVVKRKKKPADMLLKKKSSQRVTVYLANSYKFDFNRSASYTVQLQTTLHYYANEVENKCTQTVQSNKEKYFLEKKEIRQDEIVHYKQRFGEPKIIVEDHNDPYHGVAETKEAYAAARDIIGSSMDSTSENSKLYTKWFGIDFTDSVHEKYKLMYRAMEEKIYILHLHPTDNECCGYVKQREPTHIHLCGEYYEAVMRGEDSKMGIIVHEMSHSAAHTEDIEIDSEPQYGHKNCLRLAREIKEDARKNADNFEYYSEELDQ